MKAFFEKYKILKLVGFTLLFTAAAEGLSYLLNTVFIKGISADFVTSMAKTIEIIGASFLLITGVVYVCGGIKNKVDVVAANKKADDCEVDKNKADQKVLDYDKDIANGTRTIKHPNDSTKDTTVPALGTEINNITVEKNNVINKGKSAGEAIITTVTTNTIVNDLLSKNISLQAEINETTALLAKYETDPNVPAEVVDKLKKAKAIYEKQIIDNKGIRNLCDSVTGEAVKLTR